jgi:phosphopentomutase
MRAILIVLDSVRIGAAPDAAKYGDEGAATLQHIGSAQGGLRLPTLQRLGLGNIPSLLPPECGAIRGVPPVSNPLASFGAMQEVSEGKDTVTGHWEIAGLEMNPGFRIFPPGEPSFPSDLIRAFEKQTGRPVIGNRASNGVAIMNELGPRQLRDGSWIVYTSADSVFQICAHEGVIPLEELYRGCETARTLCDPYRVGRVIARPFIGEPGAFQRTGNRRDFAFQPSEPTILERCTAAGIPVYAVGKIEDIFVHRGITESKHTGNNADSQAEVLRLLRAKDRGLIFANLIDFDMLYGHMRNAPGYAAALEQTDAFLAELLPGLEPDDLLILTADHGNDPTFRGSDHTREYVPLLVYSPGRPARALGIRHGFFDIARSLADFFSLPPPPRGAGFLGPA